MTHFPGRFLFAGLLVSLLGILGAGTARAATIVPTPAGSNTIVRFVVQRGTNNPGTMDVELYDHEKPATVRNFLLYVQSGAYSNNFFHRLVPGFVVQGGGFNVTDATGTNRFATNTYQAVVDYGRLTNEFLVGARLTNLFGTIAMAKLGNDPDSANNQWFFNLGDNSANLDSQNGGFTVFGRVLETTNVGDSTNLLRSFSALSTNAGIVNLGNLLGSPFSVFSDLPVTYTNSVTRVPTNSELYTIQLSVLNATNQPGSNAPSITLTSPAPNSRFTNGVVSIRGTASDDTGIARVVYRVGGGPLQIGVGTTNWQVDVSPQLGFNSVTVQSIDCDGNFSTNTVSVTFFYAATVPLTLATNGLGTVTGATNHQNLQVGRFYTLTAKPGPGQVFDMWTGSLTSSLPLFTFQAPTNSTNFTLTANFKPDPFRLLAGPYVGLFTSTNLSLDDSGLLSLTLAKSGAFTGNITHRKGRYVFAGRFDTGGSAVVQGVIGGVSRSLSLRLALTNSAGVIVGSLIGGSSTPDVALERVRTTVSGTNAPPVGDYTFALNVDPLPARTQLVPSSYGYGTAKLARNGALQWRGTLSDGIPFVYPAKLSQANRSPVYLPLAGNQGLLIGWLAATNQTQNFDGALQWILPPNDKARRYRAGVTNLLNFQASYYPPPTNGVRVLNWVNGYSQLAGANLEATITNYVKLDPSNHLALIDSNFAALTFRIDLASGIVTGKFVHPWVGTTNAVRGIVLKRNNTVRGQFLDGDQVGGFSIDITPFLATQAVASVTLAGLTAALAEGGVIQFQTNGVITLTNTLIPRFDTLLDANGFQVTLSGGGTHRLVEVDAPIRFGAVGIQFADGAFRGARGLSGSVPQSGADGCGGGIFNRGGFVGLTNCILTNCVVYGGDAGTNSSTNQVTIGGGRGLGAALCNQAGNVGLRDCVFTGNHAYGGEGPSSGTTNPVSATLGGALGGAIYSENGSCNLTNVLFVDDQTFGGNPRALAAGGYGPSGHAAGGAVAVVGGQYVDVQSDYQRNSAIGADAPTNSVGAGLARGGALYLQAVTNALIQQATFSTNTAIAGSGAVGAPTNTLAGGAAGGALFSDGALDLRDSTLEQNQARGGTGAPAGPAWGGGLASFGTSLLNRNTFDLNQALGGDGVAFGTNSTAGGEGSGGAIYSGGPSLTATNSTLAFNRASGGAGSSAPASADGGVGNGSGGAVTLATNSAVLVNLTLAFNTAETGAAGDTNAGAATGGSFANLFGALTLRNSIVASNAPGNFSGALIDGGYNLSSDASYLFNGTASQTNLDPRLGPLTTNGGPTRTMALLFDSPARDVVPTNALPLVDQRGVTRPIGPAGDSGAFEAALAPIFPTAFIVPSNVTVWAGSNVTLQAVANGSSPFGYSWYKDSGQIAGATNASFTIFNAQAVDGGDYQVVVTNIAGAATSSIVTVVVSLRPNLLSDLQDFILSPNDSVTLSVTASGPDLTYFWYHDGAPVSFGTNNVFAITNAAPGVQGAYQVVITNSFGATNSRLASVSFGSNALAILIPPQSVTVSEGTNVSFSVLAAGVPPFAYQWFYQNARLQDATNNAYAIASVDRTNAGAYRVVVTNAYAQLVSPTANLTVNLTPGGAPALLVAAAGTNAIVKLQAAPGRAFRLLCSTNLSANARWTTLATNVVPAEGVLIWRCPMPPGNSAWFRVEQP